MTAPMPLARRLVLVAGLISGLSPVPPASAQSSRIEQIAAEQAEKATALRPYEPTRAEQIVANVGDSLANPPTGLYPWFGSILRGGWVAVGPGVRLPYGDTGLVEAHAAWSLRNYKVLDGQLHLPALAGRRVRIDLHGQWLDAPKVTFFGLGNDSRSNDRSSFLYKPTRYGVGVQVTPARFVHLGGNLDYVDIDSGPGTGGVSIDERFAERDVPGLSVDPTYTRSHLFAAFDWRQSPGYTRRGGLYRVDWTRYTQHDNGRFGFRRLDAELQQHVPLVRENFVLAFRGLMSITTTDAGDAVPYFLMPDLGGSSELRGYASWRFRDRHRLLLTGEYRWTPSHFADMAIFVDAGKVTDRRSDLNLDNLRRSYGAGIRFHAPNATIMRIELARGQEGFNLVFAFSPVF